MHFISNCRVKWNIVLTVVKQKVPSNKLYSIQFSKKLILVYHTELLLFKKRFRIPPYATGFPMIR